MKTMIQLLAALGFSTGLALASTPIEIMTPIEHIYSPAGFDSNDNTEIVIEGYLPNLCHKSPRSEVTITEKKIDIKVMALRYDNTDPFCPEAVVPFVETVKVGLLDKGKYEIVVNGRSVHKKKGIIEIAEASSNSVDEYIYANVENISKSVNSRTVEIKGYNPSDCFVLEEIIILDNKKDVYSVLPKMEQISDFCPMKMVPFTYKFEVPERLKKDKVLLHVRGMNGNSINSLFYNRQSTSAE